MSTPEPITAIRPVDPRRGRLRPLGVNEVRITGGFWGQRQHVNATATLAHCLHWMDRLGWTGNFRAAAGGRLPEDRAGREFSDSETYKLVEAMAWERARDPAAPVDTAIDRLAAQVGAAQEPDGYLNTAFGRPGQPPRYSDLQWGHELYCYGHLIQAGVAQARAGGSDGIVEIARRAADHVCATFGPDGSNGLCGHPEIEMALVELARLTGEQRYLDQAALFIERRGRRTMSDRRFGLAYHLDDVPVREARVLRGHAVRALYLASGAVDVAVETGDDDLLAAVVRQWEATVARRTYLTGGMGGRHVDEAFGEDFMLPPDRAYSETCAGVASVMLAWRLLLATGEPRFADLAERTLYNVVATAVAPDGRAFFYTNTLHQRRAPAAVRGDGPSPRAASGLRAPWFAVSCCPTNVARTLASLAAYVATADGDGLQLHQYADAEIRTALDDGRSVGVSVSTAYPADGEITVRITETPPTPWTLSLRVPSWVDGGAVLTEPGGRRRAVSAGTAGVRRRFTVGDVVRLELPVEPRWTAPDPRIDAIRGTLAVEQGPLVLCVESTDLPEDRDVGVFVVDPRVAPLRRGERVVVAGALATPAERPWPYGAPGEVAVAGGPATPRGTASGSEPAGGDQVEVALVPYHDWGNRGPSTMRVWLPVMPVA
jgi:hypothetical protein